MTFPDGRTVPGSLAEEAGRLMEALAGWSREGDAGDPGSAAGQEHPTTCRYCPLCRLLAMLQGRTPDLGAQLADSGMALAQAGAAFAEAMRAAFVPPTAEGAASAGAAGTGEPDPGGAAEEQERTDEPPPVERIDVR